MAEVRGMGCCALQELDGISYDNGPEDIIRSTFVTNDYDPNGALIIFTQAGNKSRYGFNLANYIRKKRLGTVTKLPVVTNPNTHNPIHTFIWKHNANLQKLIEKMKSEA